MTALGWLQAPVPVAVVLMLCIVSAALGRSSAPPEVREVETARYAEAVAQRDALSRQVAELRAEVSKRAEAKERVVVRVVRPDGTRIERERERSAAVAETASVATRASTEHREAAATRRSEGERTTVRTETPRRSDWRVGLLAGAQLRADPLTLVPMFGADVSYRVLGPFSLGVLGTFAPPTATRAPEFGLMGSLSVEF